MQEIIEHVLKSPSVTVDVLMTNAPFRCHSIDQNGVLLNVSNKWADCLGYAPSEMIGQRSVDFLTPESRKRAIESILPEFYARGSISGVPYTFQTSLGSHVDVLMAAVLIPQNNYSARSLAIMFENESQVALNALRTQLAAARADLSLKHPDALTILDGHVSTD